MEVGVMGGKRSALDPAHHCRSLPPELFFANRAGRYPVPREQLERLCLGDRSLGIPPCPAFAACLEAAIDGRVKGWHGGTDEVDREGIRRRRAPAA
jgi:hypothetical protein